MQMEFPSLWDAISTRPPAPPPSPQLAIVC